MITTSPSQLPDPPWAGIVIVPGLRGGRPVIRGMRIAVGDVLGWLASGMSEAEILEDFPELAERDIRAALAFAAEREHGTAVASSVAAEAVLQAWHADIHAAAENRASSVEVW